MKIYLMNGTTPFQKQFHTYFSLLLEKANSWLESHPEYRVKGVQSVDIPVPYTSLNLRVNTAATDFYIDEGSRFYSRTLRYSF